MYLRASGVLFDITKSDVTNAYQALPMPRIVGLGTPWPRLLCVGSSCSKFERDDMRGVMELLVEFVHTPYMPSRWPLTLHKPCLVRFKIPGWRTGS